MPPLRALSLLAFTIGLCLPSSAHAVAPQVQWRTISTPSFRVHFHEDEGMEALAQRVAAIAEAALPELDLVFGHTTERPIQVVLTDETDSANGFAEVLPNNTITLFPAVPEPFSTLGDYDDYLRLLVIHELTHVVHLDTVGGIPALVNDIFGRVWIPNGVQPQWFVEGVAVWIESKLTGGGRVRSGLIDLFLRAMLLAGRLPTLDRLSHFTRQFPGGGLNWYVGGRFVDFIARRHGAEAIQKISLAYSSRLIPYGLNLVAVEATGETFEELYDAWVAEELEAARADVAKVRGDGVVDGEALENGSPLVLYPRLSKSGLTAWVELPRDDDAELVIKDGAKELLRVRAEDGRGTFLPDGRFVATVVDAHLLSYSYSDLELIDPIRRERRRLTAGARLFEPDARFDGLMVAVGQSAGQTFLVTVDEHGTITRVPGTMPGAQLSRPVWSPDGRSIVVSQLGEGATRHLWLYDPDRGPVRPITFGASRDLDPAWSADGQSVYFSRDTDGIFDIHRVEVQTGVVERVTRVETGAFQPVVAPDGQSLLFVLGTQAGWALRRLSLPARALAAGSSQARPHFEARQSATVWPVEDYQAWPTLLPRAYLPSTGLDGVGDTIGIYVSGTDALKLHSYGMRVDYGLQSERINFDASYTNRQTPVSIGLGAGLRATSRFDNFVPTTQDDDRLLSVFRARVGAGVGLGRWDGGHYLALSYGIELRRGFDPPPRDPLLPLRPSPDLDLGSLSLSWSFSNARGFEEGYGAARGQSFDLSLRLNDPLLGSDLRVLELYGRWGGYFRLPWLTHHVLALRVSAGGSAGDPGQRAVFALGGLPIRDVLTDAIDGVGFSSDVIRGYPVAVLRGTAFYLSSIEYRFPIFAFSKGYATFPVFVDRLHAAVFVDAGATPNRRIDLLETKVGVGAELRLDLFFGYYLGYTLRFGYGRGLSEGGIDNLYLVLGGSY